MLILELAYWAIMAVLFLIALGWLLPDFDEEDDD